VSRRFAGLETDTCPFANLPEKLVAQVAFADWTEANHLRHARFLGLRDDKAAREVVQERAA
jgi:bifunctional non-homologous end joining protein LigD